MRNKLISVITPIYDRTDLLKQSIESVLCQTHQELELLLIMDNSPKETREVVMSYYDNPRVRIFETFNQTGNACIPRNIGIKEASGEIISFLDSDDLMMPDRLEKVFKHIENYDLIHGDFYLLRGEERTLRHHRQQAHNELLMGNGICQSTVSAKTQVLRAMNGFKRKMNYCEDYELYCRMSEKGYSIKYIPEVFSVYRFHEGNLEKEIGDLDKWKPILLNEYKIIPSEMDLVEYKEINL